MSNVVFETGMRGGRLCSTCMHVLYIKNVYSVKSMIDYYQKFLAFLHLFSLLQFLALESE